MTTRPDQHGNRLAQEGCDRCYCGCKYWENDRCLDCGTSILTLRRDMVYDLAPDEDNR